MPKCSLCQAPGVNKLSCPLNPASKRPRAAAHKVVVDKKVHIPSNVLNVAKGLPALKKEYGGLIDFKMNGSFEALRVHKSVAAQNFLFHSVPEDRIIWHNHPTKPSANTKQPPSADDVKVFLQRAQAIHSVVFAPEGVYIQSLPPGGTKKDAKALMQTNGVMSNHALAQRVQQEAQSKPFYRAYIDVVLRDCGVKTRFVPWTRIPASGIAIRLTSRA